MRFYALIILFKKTKIRPPFQALLTFKKLVKLLFFDHIITLKTDIQEQQTDKI